MHTPNPLLDALCVPWQVVVHQHGAELQVDAFCGSFGGDHDPATFPEFIDESLASIGRLDSGN